MARDLGVTGPQRLVIRVVGLAPGLSAGALARILHVHPSTLTGILQRLWKQGVITRAADPVDARRSVLRLTPRGQRVNAAMGGTVETAVRAALKDVPPRDRRAAHAVLSAVSARLAEAGAMAAASRHRPRARTA
jgi:DNA-binding MarR family transcriptional regulator